MINTRKLEKSLNDQCEFANSEAVSEISSMLHQIDKKFNPILLQKLKEKGEKSTFNHEIISETKWVLSGSLFVGGSVWLGTLNEKSTYNSKIDHYLNQANFFKESLKKIPHEYHELKKELMDLIVKIDTIKEQITHLRNSSGGSYSIFQWLSAKIPGFGYYKLDKEIQKLLTELIACNCKLSSFVNQLDCNPGVNCAQSDEYLVIQALSLCLNQQYNGEILKRTLNVELTPQVLSIQDGGNS
jgi:hypothetical protein